MAITGFTITELPDPSKIAMTISGLPVVIGVVYPITDQANVLFTRVDGNNTPAKPFTTFKYTVTNGTETSNEATVTLSWRPQLNGGVEPTASNFDIVRTDNDAFSIGDYFTVWSSNTTSIKIVTISEIAPGQLKLNGNTVYEGDIIPLSELDNFTFHPQSSGSGDPYFTFVFNACNEFGCNTINYLGSITINILADFLDFPSTTNFDNETLTVDGVEDAYDTIYESTILKIDKGIVNGTAEVEIDINSPFLSLNDVNRIVLDIDGEEIEKFDNETFTLKIPLNEKGEFLFNITNFAARNTASAINGNITATLLSINGSASNVSVNNTINLILNIA